MSQNSAGPGWKAELTITPKKHKAFEDKLGSDTPARFDHRINDLVAQKEPLEPRVIADSDSDFSDDHDDDDDDLELPSIDAILNLKKDDGKKKPLVFRSGESSVEATPERKLANFMAIINDTKEADELDRMQEAAARELESSPMQKRPEKMERRALFKEAVNIVQGDENGDDSDKEQHFTKVRQAMDRQAAQHDAPSYYFFASATHALAGVRTPAPGPPVAGSMTAREDDHRFNLSLQSNLATKYGGNHRMVLPDELVVWLLDVFPTERSEVVRAEYLGILSDRSEQVGRLITKERLKHLFRSIGADDDAMEALTETMPVARRSARKISRDWVPIHNALELLRHCCAWMAAEPLVHATVWLLRASMDNDVRLQAAVATAVNDTLSTLAVTLRDTSRANEQEKYCRKVCNLFIQTVDSANLLSRAVEATHHAGLQPQSTSQAPGGFDPFTDLRTRLQLTVFFNDADRASRERCGTAPLLLRAILSRLDDAEFKGTRATGGRGGRSAINYYDLDGYGLVLTGILPLLHYLRQQVGDSAEVAEFTSGIDDLRRKVSLVNSTIQIVGSMEELEARHEAKNRWQRVDHWVSHFFPKKGAGNIFHEEMTAEDAEAEEKAVQRQARLMEKWAKKEPMTSA